MGWTGLHVFSAWAFLFARLGSEIVLLPGSFYESRFLNSGNRAGGDTCDKPDTAQHHLPPRGEGLRRRRRKRRIFDDTIINFGRIKLLCSATLLFWESLLTKHLTFRNAYIAIPGSP